MVKQWQWLLKGEEVPKGLSERKARQLGGKEGTSMWGSLRTAEIITGNMQTLHRYMHVLLQPCQESCAYLHCKRRWHKATCLLTLSWIQMLSSLYPTVPVFYCSCIPLSLYPTVPVPYYLCTPLSLYPTVPIFHCPCTPLSLFPTVPVSLCPCTPNAGLGYWCASTCWRF